MCVHYFKVVLLLFFYQKDIVRIDLSMIFVRYSVLKLFCSGVLGLSSLTSDISVDGIDEDGCLYRSSFEPQLNTTNKQGPKT